MNLKKKVSIIIATQNRYEDLCETLNKIKLQTYKNYEVIVVDSSDEFISKKIKKKFKFIKYIRGIKGKGRINAFNIGLKSASADIILTLDDDSFPGLKSISRSVKIFDKNPNVGLIGFNILHYSDYIKRYNQLDGVFKINDFKENFHWSGCGGAFRKDIVKKLGSWEEWCLITPYELTMCCKTIKLKYQCISHDKIFVLHKWAPPGNPIQRLQQDGIYIYSCTISFFLYVIKYYPLSIKTILFLYENILKCLIDFIIKNRFTVIKAMFHSLFKTNKYIKKRITIDSNKLKNLQIPSNFIGK